MASDLSLCNHLAFWTGKSATRMDSMFRETSLIRDKWLHRERSLAE
ncbi:phage NrS-1 polymerase family protein [Escherichia coli]